MTDEERERERARYRRKMLEPGWKERRRAWSNAATRAYRARMSAEARSTLHRARYELLKLDPAQVARRRARALAYYHRHHATEAGAVAYRKRARDYYQLNRTRFLLRYIIRNPTVKGNRMRSQQTEALRLLSAAIIEAIDAAGPAGAPSGAVYAGLMVQGCTLEQYEQLIDGLRRAGMIEQSGNLLTATDKGRTFAKGIK